MIHGATHLTILAVSNPGRVKRMSQTPILTGGLYLGKLDVNDLLTRGYWIRDTHDPEGIITKILPDSGIMGHECSIGQLLGLSYH